MNPTEWAAMRARIAAIAAAMAHVSAQLEVLAAEMALAERREK